MTDPRLRRHELGFLEVVDRPNADELAAYYADTYYQTEQSNYRRHYPDEELAAIRLRIEQRAAEASAHLRLQRPGRFLDVGCGEGFAIKWFADRGWDAAGIDFSAAAAKAMNPDIADRVDKGDLFTLLQTRIDNGETYDLVWLANVLEHVLDPIGLLRDLRKLVHPQGVLVVTVPNDGGAYHEALYQSGDIDRRFWIAIPDHISYFTSESLEAIASSTGWQTASVLGDFPIDLFLAHPGSNYVADRTKGSDAHRARLRLEAQIGAAGTEAANRFYASLAEVGLGRNITAFLRPEGDDR